ncbi:uncharacterized protein GJ701_004413 [Geothlypis trichas]
MQLSKNMRHPDPAIDILLNKGGLLRCLQVAVLLLNLMGSSCAMALSLRKKKSLEGKGRKTRCLLRVICLLEGCIMDRWICHAQVPVCITFVSSFLHTPQGASRRALQAVRREKKHSSQQSTSCVSTT